VAHDTGVAKNVVHALVEKTRSGMGSMVPKLEGYMHGKVKLELEEVLRGYDIFDIPKNGRGFGAVATIVLGAVIGMLIVCGGIWIVGWWCERRKGRNVVSEEAGENDVDGRLVDEYGQIGSLKAKADFEVGEGRHRSDRQWLEKEAM
jgi:hypothetical protein